MKKPRPRVVQYGQVPGTQGLPITSRDVLLIEGQRVVVGPEVPPASGMAAPTAAQSLRGAPK